MQESFWGDRFLSYPDLILDISFELSIEPNCVSQTLIISPYEYSGFSR